MSNCVDKSIISGLHWTAIVHFGISVMIGITLFAVLMVLLEAFWEILLHFEK